MKLPSICLAVVLLAACQEKTAQKSSIEQEEKIVKNSEQEHIEDSVTIEISSQKLDEGNRVESVTPFLDYFGVNKDPVVKVRVEPSKSRVVKIQNGGEIKIPANCFVDRSGNPITEPVELVYDEIRSPAEIIFTDVDMKYDSAGVTYDFQTAGMFDISANVNGEEVFIASGKHIDIDYADSGKDQEFNFYHYDEDQKNWTYQNVSRVEPKNTSSSSNSSIPVSNASRVAPGNWLDGGRFGKFNIPKPLAEKFEDRKVFDLKYPIVWTGSNEVLSCVMWQYAGKGKKQDPMEFDDFFKTDWNSVELTKLEGKVARFRAKFTSGRKRFVTVLQPVAEGVFKEEYDRIRLAAIEKVKKVQAQAEAQKQKLVGALKVRRAQITNFGLYNYDRMFKQPGFKQFAGVFKFSDKSDQKDAYVFLVTGDDDVVIRYPYSDFGKMAYSPDESYKMIAVLPNKRIAVMNNQEFMSAVSKKNGKTVEFSLDVFEQEVASPSDLENLLASI